MSIRKLRVATYGVALTATVALSQAVVACSGTPTTDDAPSALSIGVEGLSDGIAFYPACSTEDGPVPCVWAGWERGNRSAAHEFTVVHRNGATQHDACTADYLPGCMYREGDWFVLVTS